MSDYYQPMPFLIIAASRSGGTFLTHCFDSHPQVSCERDSPLDPESYWRQWVIATDEESTLPSEVELLHALWQRSGYHAAGFKLSYRQARRVGLEWLASSVNNRVLHLYRSNPLRTVVSSHINTAVQNGELDHPVHSYQSITVPANIVLDPDWFLSECRRYIANVDSMMEELTIIAAGEWLCLTYDMLVGAEGQEAEALSPHVAWSLCDWLSIERRELTCGLRRVNPQPLREVVENWADIERVVRADGRFAEWLKEE